MTNQAIAGLGGAELSQKSRTDGVARLRTVKHSSTHGPGRPNLTVLNIPDFYDIIDVLAFLDILGPVSQLLQICLNPALNQEETANNAQTTPFMTLDQPFNLLLMVSIPP